MNPYSRVTHAQYDTNNGLTLVQLTEQAHAPEQEQQQQQQRDIGEEKKRRKNKNGDNFSNPICFLFSIKLYFITQYLIIFN